MSDLDTLNQKLAQVQADVATLGTAASAVAAEVTTLNGNVASLTAQLAALQASNPTIDLSGPIATAITIDQSLGTIQAALQAALPAAPASPTT